LPREALAKSGYFFGFMIETEPREASTASQTEEAEARIFEELERQGGRIAGLLRQPRFIVDEFRTEESKKRALQKVLSFFALRLVWGIDSLPDPTDRAKRYYDYMVKAACHGEKLLLSEASKNLLSGCDKDITGAENIPKKGPLLIICNHWKDGPLWGMWQSFLISELTNEIREPVEHNGRPVSQEVGHYLQSSLEIAFGIPWTNIKYRTGWELWGSKYILDLVAEAYDLTTVNPPFKISRGNQEHIRPNSSFDRLEAGGIVGLYPEARKTRELEKAWDGSGRLVRVIRRRAPKTQILPVAATSAGYHLFLNFGQPFEIERWKGMTPEQINDGMMQEISALIAPSCQGEYRI